MKHEKSLTLLIASVLAFSVSFGAVGCIASAFHLTLEWDISGFLVCLLFSILSAALFSARYGGLIFICLTALIWGYLYHDGRAAEQFCQLLYQLTEVYDRAYGCGVLPLPAHLQGSMFSDFPLCILGAHLAAAVAWSVCRQKSCLLPVLLTLLSLCSCIVVTDTVPGEFWLFLVMAGLLLLILTASVRYENAAQGIRLTAAASVPVILGLIILFHTVPQDGYVNQSKLLQKKMITTFQNLSIEMEERLADLTAGLKRQPPKQVDLTRLGRRELFSYPVMEVTAQRSGTLYLREQDYALYDGLGWTSGSNREEIFSYPTEEPQTLQIRTRNPKEFFFLPYYPLDNTLLTDGSAVNPLADQEYIVACCQLPDNWRQIAYRQATGTPAEYQAYLTLPEATLQGAAPYLKHLSGSSESNTAKADMIAATVLDSARYDLSPEKMPSGEPDFALWFLRDGSSGYCVHFASAATVLLRAAGIPARYVTGYMLEAAAGETVTVTEENAHAWAEYYEPNLNLWIPLEATPATGNSPQVLPQPAATESTDATEVTQMTESTEITTPTEPETDPFADTIPSSETELPQPTAAEPPAAAASTGSKILLPLLLLPAAILLLAVQRSLRLSFRRKQQRTGNPNQQALHRWQESVRLARLLKESPTEELIVLAQKAKFSQYELTQEELLQFDSFNRTCLKQLKKKTWYLQLIHQYIYAAY